MALKRGIVELEEFNDKWFEEYEKEEKFLKEKLNTRAIEIHHVGSTSIKGLSAKPVIDILVVIEKLDKIKEIEDILKDYNYSNRGHQGVDDRYFFAKGSEEARTHYIHFVEKNSNTYYNLLYFKKYLNDNPEYIEKYAKLKKDLADKYKDERSKYTAGKNEFITSVINLAKKIYKE